MLGGSERRFAECDEGDVGDSGEVAAIAACWAGQCYISGLVGREEEDDRRQWSSACWLRCVSGDDQPN